MRESLRNTIATRMAELGWTIVQAPAIVLKMYDTAVGPKQASVYLSGPDEYNYTLYGMYWTEGRNCLEGSGVLIPVGASSEQVLQLVDKFAAQADKAVGESYAAKLLRSFAEPATC